MRQSSCHSPAGGRVATSLAARRCLVRNARVSGTLNPMNTQRLLAWSAAAAAALCCNVQAMDLTPRGAFVVGGTAPHSTNSVTAGAIWTWDWRRQTARGEFTAITEAYVSYWKTDGFS